MLQFRCKVNSLTASHIAFRGSFPKPEFKKERKGKKREEKERKGKKRKEKERKGKKRKEKERKGRRKEKKKDKGKKRKGVKERKQTRNKAKTILQEARPSSNKARKFGIGSSGLTKNACQNNCFSSFAAIHADLLQRLNVSSKTIDVDAAGTATRTWETAT